MCGSCQQKDGLVCSELLRLTVTSRQRLPRHLSLRHKLTSVKQQPRISCFSRLLAKFSPSEKYSQSAFGLPGCAQFSHCLVILSSAEIYSRQVGVLNKIRFTAYYYLLSPCQRMFSPRTEMESICFEVINAKNVLWQRDERKYVFICVYMIRRNEIGERK